VLGSARAQPLVVATEDLHWADPSTLELIQLLVEQGAGARLLLLYTARPEFQAPWPMRAHHTQINLNRLGVRDVRAMVAQVAASKELANETIATVIERTGGVPLFVEELTRAVLEGGDSKLTGREIPATLHDSLMARLDRLGPAKEVIQIAAVIGGEVSYQLIHAVHPMSEAELQAALHKLTDAELLYVRGLAPEATYQFKHALIRDAAYEALLKSRRKELHLIVARTIDEKFPALKDIHPEIVAHHWSEAGETEPAIAEWSRAAKTAEARNAFREALENYKKALALLTTLPASPERDSREIALRISTVRALFQTRGPAVTETIDANERASALAEKSGNLAQVFMFLSSKCQAICVTGDLRAADALADQALELALRLGGPWYRSRAHTLLSFTHYLRGDLVGAEDHITTGLMCFDDSFSSQVGTAALTFGTASSCAWILGRADLARERTARMMALTNENHPYDLAYSNLHAAFLKFSMREFEEAEALATRTLELCEKHQFPNLAALFRCIIGHARAQLGQATAGIGLIRRGIADLLEIGWRVGLSTWMAVLASAQALDGGLGDALETVEQALQVNPDELVSRPEILRIRGELRLKLGNSELAKADFHEAIALAQTMSAKTFELRGTMSLAQLLRDTGRRDEARAMLSDIYGWFTDGFDTADLKDAKTLLDELSG
jgi:tetratricopeptide (TPR) repeat protein